MKHEKANENMHGFLKLGLEIGTLSLTSIGQASYMAEFRSLCTVGGFFKGS